MSEFPRNPGSFKDFVEQHGLQNSPQEAIKWHSAAISQYRQQLAEAHGITTEELHSSSLDELATRAGQLILAEAQAS